MGMARKFNELQTEAEIRGIVLNQDDFDHKIGKREYIEALQAYSLDKMREEGSMTPGVEWIHANLESPMLACAQSSVKPEVFEKIISDQDIAFEEKVDGCRMIVTYFPGVGFEMFSRNRSVQDFLFNRHTDQIYGLTRLESKDWFTKPFVLDCEVYSTNKSFNGRIVSDTNLAAMVACLALERNDSWQAQKETGFPIRFRVFDCIMVNGKNVMQRKLKDRKEYVHRIVEQMHQFSAEKAMFSQLFWFEENKWWTGGKEAKLAKFDEMMKNKKEGLILKDLESTYNATENRLASHGAPWLKLKSSISAMLESKGIEKDLDCFVSGFIAGSEGTANEGIIGALEFSVYLLPSGKQHRICSIGSLPLELRKSITDYDENGNVCLKEEWYGKVAIVEGTDISSRARAYTHARLIRWREEAEGKTAFDCTMEEAILNDMVL